MKKTVYFRLEYYKDTDDLSYKYRNRLFINFLRKIKKLKYVFGNIKRIESDDKIEYICYTVQNKEEKRIIKIVSSMVGDIQRMIIFPQFGWQIKQEVPQEVQNAYRKLKSMGFDEFVISKEKIKQEIEKYGIIEKEPILWD